MVPLPVFKGCMVSWFQGKEGEVLSLLVVPFIIFTWTEKQRI